jgi:hypothetical protein
MAGLNLLHCQICIPFRGNLEFPFRSNFVFPFRSGAEESAFRPAKASLSPSETRLYPQSLQNQDFSIEVRT